MKNLLIIAALLLMAYSAYSDCIDTLRWVSNKSHTRVDSCSCSNANPDTQGCCWSSGGERVANYVECDPCSTDLLDTLLFYDFGAEPLWWGSDVSCNDSDCGYCFPCSTVDEGEIGPGVKFHFVDTICVPCGDISWVKLVHYISMYGSIRINGHEIVHHYPGELPDSLWECPAESLSGGENETDSSFWLVDDYCNTLEICAWSTCQCGTECISKMIYRLEIGIGDTTAPALADSFWNLPYNYTNWRCCEDSTDFFYFPFTVKDEPCSQCSLAIDSVGLTAYYHGGASSVIPYSTLFWENCTTLVFQTFPCDTVDSLVVTHLADTCENIRTGNWWVRFYSIYEIADF